MLKTVQDYTACKRQAQDYEFRIVDYKVSVLSIVACTWKISFSFWVLGYMMFYRTHKYNLTDMQKHNLYNFVSYIYFFFWYLEWNMADVRKQQASAVVRNLHPHKHQLPKCFLSYILIFLRSTPSAPQIDTRICLQQFSCQVISPLKMHYFDSHAYLIQSCTEEAQNTCQLIYSKGKRHM